MEKISRTVSRSVFTTTLPLLLVTPFQGLLGHTHPQPVGIRLGGLEAQKQDKSFPPLSPASLPPKPPHFLFLPSTNTH